MDKLEGLQSVPSYDPNAEEFPQVAFDYILENENKKLNVCLPAVVLEYDRTNNVAIVVPAINIASETGEFIKQPSLNVSVLQPAGGGFIISLPMKKGDTGFLIFCDKDISLFKQHKKIINPNTNRSHALEDCFFIPDFINHKPNVGDFDNLIIQKTDGTCKISISNDDISIIAPKLKIQGDVEIDGNVSVSGTIEAQGDMTGNGISLSGHVHGDVQSGGDKTGRAE